ncbi:hypothetical protein SFRURICE_019260 [Spodoptera frugiperda]|nr:hypothetical protein SFRURICE_019260 [Spodoptera frugiperda]
MLISFSRQWDRKVECGAISRWHDIELNIVGETCCGGRRGRGRVDPHLHMPTELCSQQKAIGVPLSLPSPMGDRLKDICPNMGWSCVVARAVAIFLMLSRASALTSDIFAAGKSDKEILDNLLKNSRYDKRLLPPVDDPEFCCGLTSPNDSLAQNNVGLSSLRPRSHNRGVLTVNVSVLLLSLASPDESSLKYEVEFLLQQQWYDPRLRYSNQSHYDFLNAIHHHEDIWLPDTYFIMHGDFKDPIIPMHFALRIYRNGTINYLMRRHLILSCQGRLNIFPFDDPLCSFALESISYEQSAITYVWKNDEDTLRKSPSLTTLNAYLIQNQTIPCPIKASWRGNYSCLKVDLIFTRDRAFYFTTVFIPGIILVTSSFITFWLEWNAVPARSMIEFVCVNYVGRKRPLHNVVYRPGENPVTQRLPAVLSRIGIILASPLEAMAFLQRARQEMPQAETSGAGDKKRESTGGADLVSCTACTGPGACTHTANNGGVSEVRKKEPPHPIRVAKTIDVIARITFPTAYAVFLIFFFIHYKAFS